MYKYPIDQCDISDKAKGESFRQMRMKWVRWLHGEDPHSISRQISSILWDYALFISVNELRCIRKKSTQCHSEERSDEES